jgi:hypothetical protein
VLLHIDFVGTRRKDFLHLLLAAYEGHLMFLPYSFLDRVELLLLMLFILFIVVRFHAIILVLVFSSLLFVFNCA